MDAAPPVALLRWPRDEAERSRLTRERLPRILLVDVGHAAPMVDDELEDWIRTPAEEELFLRIDHLEEARRGGPDLRALADGVLRYNGTTLVLSAAQARLAVLLFRRPWRLVNRDELGEAWGGATRSRRTLDGAIARLRARLVPLGLTITAIRGRGFMLRRVKIDDD